MRKSGRKLPVCCQATNDPVNTPERSNIHLATSDGKRDPLTLYREGGFDEWQRFQGGKRRAFTRSFVVAVIKTETRHHWLLAGVYDVVSEQKRQIRVPRGRALGVAAVGGLRLPDVSAAHVRQTGGRDRQVRAAL